MSKQLIKEAIKRIAVGPERGRNISQQQAQQIMQAILAGDIGDVPVAVFLIGLRMKGESLDEMAGLFSALQQDSNSHAVNVPELWTLAEPFNGYDRHLSISAFMPCVLAALGLPSVIYGVDSVGPKHGITAANIYQMAGLDCALTSSQAAEKIQQQGWVFLHQEKYAPRLYQLAELRDQMVKRTALTTLERCLMPLQAQQKTHLVLGYVHKAYPQIYSHIAKQAGFASALLVKGVEGGLTPALNKPLRYYALELQQALPNEFAEFKQGAQTIAGLKTDSAAVALSEQQRELIAKRQKTQLVEDCLQQGLAVLEGQQGLAADSLCLALAPILVNYQKGSDYTSAIKMVRECLQSGKARAFFKA